MLDPAGWAAAACGAAAAAGIVYTVAAGALVIPFFRRPPAAPKGFPPVTVVKPLHGAEEGLLENLASFCAQDYPGPVQYLFGTRDPQDPALATVAELRRRFPAATISVVADPRQHGPNRKISNLINLMPQAEHELLVFADSDVGVAPDYLRQVVGALQEPGVGAVTCVYRGKAEPVLWSRLSAIATDCQLLPSIITGLAVGLAEPCFGQTIALRRSTLEAIGGFAAFREHLAEDHAIGHAVRRLGARVVIPPFAVTHASAETTLGALVSHELRWSRTIRAIDPKGHLGSLVTHPVGLALLAVLAARGAAWTWALLALAVGARLRLKWKVDHALGISHGDLGLVPLWDLLSLPLFAASFLSGRVTWRGSRYRVDRKGRLSEPAREAPPRAVHREASQPAVSR